MATNTNTFSGFVSNMATTIQGYAAQLVDFTTGSILLAVVQAFASVLMWMQAQILSVLATTRAATSTGSDLDSWMADYGFTRLPAASATTSETISRYTDTATAFLYVTGTESEGVISGTAVVQSQDGTVQYAILADSTNPYWTAGLGALGGYTVPGGVASITVPVGCLTAGSTGNLAANQVNTLATALPGWDACTNAEQITNGSDPESDAAFRLRFIAYIASLSKATKTAIAEAIASVQDNVSYTITENSPSIGNFAVVVDDGSGDPSTTFLNNVAAAVDAVRPLTVEFTVNGPTTLTATVAMVVTIASGYDESSTLTLVQTAISNYIAALPLGAGLPITRLAQVAYDASPGVINVNSISLNGSSTSSISGSPGQLIKPWTYAVSSAGIAAGGSGYSNGNVLTISGGTFSTSAQLTVSTVGAGGVITGVTVSRAGTYSSMPSMPAAVSGGGGSGATFNLGTTTTGTVTVTT